MHSSNRSDQDIDAVLDRCAEVEDSGESHLPGMSKARRGTKANPFEIGEKVVIRKVGWKGVVRDRRGMMTTGAQCEYLVEHGHEWHGAAGSLNPSSWLEARYLEVDELKVE